MGDDLLPGAGLLAAERVARCWRDEGVAMETGVPDATLDAIERVHGVTFPPSFRALWRLVDGTGGPDRHWLIFVQASDLVQPLYAPREGQLVTMMFADWRQATATFSLRLAPADAGVVVIGHTTELLAPSFDAFLELYLNEQTLWPR
jgi:hypothetical protein